MEVRQRRNHVIETVRSLDAFPKMDGTYMRTTRFGGTISLCTFMVCAVLIYTEWRYYIGSIRFRFETDTDMDALLPLHIDIVVATPCSMLSSDVIDSTYAAIGGADSLERIDTWWQMSDEQEAFFTRQKQTNAFLRDNYHGLKETLMQRGGFNWMVPYFPERRNKPASAPDSCRFRGKLVLHKVAGDFRINTFQLIQLPGLNIQLFAANSGNLNLSHRIIRFQFGDTNSGLVNPIEGVEFVSERNNAMVRYFVEVVPTDIHGLLGTTHTYQYSAKQQIRNIDHDKGSHGQPGFFVRYQMAALKVVISENRQSLAQFLLRMCTMCGGIYVVAGAVNSLIGGLLCFRRGDSDAPPSSVAYSPLSNVLLDDCATVVPSKRQLAKLTVSPPTSTS